MTHLGGNDMEHVVVVQGCVVTQGNLAYVFNITLGTISER